MNRLIVLCKLHGCTGGTIHQYNRLWKTDFLAMSEKEWQAWLKSIEKINPNDLKAAARRGL